MIATAIVILFIVGMAYWWSIQGLFSALLHLGFVLVAGTLAFALWEYLAQLCLSFDQDILSQYAWGVGLLLPFAIILGVLRFAGDTLVPGNLRFPALVDSIGGGLVGLASGTLTAGIAVISLGFIPLDYDLNAGWAPYVVTSTGQVEKRGGWLPRVDAVSAQVFKQLSDGAFSPLSGESLARNYPALARQSAEFRLAREIAPKKSLIASPEGVTLGEVALLPTPVEGIDPAVANLIGEGVNAEGRQLLAVETLWDNTQPQTGDSTLRVYPVEVRLLVEDADGRKRYVTPLAFSREYRFSRDGEVASVRDLKAVDDNEVAAFGDVEDTRITWVFVLDKGQTPYAITTRNLRHTIKPSREPAQPEEVLALIGQVRPGSDADDDGEDGNATAGAEGGNRADFGTRDGRAGTQYAEFIELGTPLPFPISRNQVSAIQAYGDTTAIREGTADDVERPRNLSNKLKLDSIYVPSQFQGVRVKVERDDARSLLGQAARAGMSVQAIWLEDGIGEKYFAVGYVWRTREGLTINIDPNRPFDNVARLPIRSMREGDDLYLYFYVRRGVTIRSYNVGPTAQSVEFPIPTE